MDISIPTVLKSLSTAGAAIKEIAAWRKSAKGNSRALIDELKNNLTYLDLVAEDGVSLSEVIDKLSITEYKRLSKEWTSFNTLKSGKIEKYASLEGSDLSNWGGKSTDDLVISIYDKINQLIIRYPYVQHSKKYRWKIRVNNIRKRIWLLLRHVRG
jgi:hypothetical protein